MPLLSYHCLNQLPNNKLASFNEGKLKLFLKEVEKGYQSEVIFHNSLHAVDVMQYLFSLLKYQGLIE